jgi:hypothetical protein
MIAIAASLFVLFYVLVPGGVFRIFLSMAVPLKKFHKTKTQEITFAVLASFLPFWFAMALVWSGVNKPFPTTESKDGRRQAYHIVFAALNDAKEMETSMQNGLFWHSVTSVLRRQGRFLFWFYVLVVSEAATFRWLISHYRSLRKYHFYNFVADHFLIPSISEWHVLLTDFSVRQDGPREIHVDALTTEGILYRGKINSYFLNTEGELAGILLTGADRFDKEEYVAHRNADIQALIAGNSGKAMMKAKSEYWKRIRGANLFYIPGSRISNLNARHEIPIPAAAKAAQDRLNEQGIKGE